MDQTHVHLNNCIHLSYNHCIIKLYLWVKIHMALCFYAQAMSKTIQQFQTANITVVSTQSFIDDPSAQIQNLLVGPP